MTTMTEQEELERWLRIVNELRAQLTIEALAEKIGVSERTICNWQNGDRPMGLKAIRVYLLHVELCNGLHRSALPSGEVEKG